MERVNTAVTFADLAGFSALTEAHGDTAAADTAQQFVEIARSLLGAGDRLIKTIGDAVLLHSVEPTSAVTLILSLFDACERDPRFLDVRAGAHVGPVVERAGDIFGATVNIAARIAATAAGGQIIVTAPIAEAAVAVNVEVRRLGPTVLHNIVTPVELFKLVRSAAGDRDVDPVCRMRVNQVSAAGCLTYGGRDYLFCSLGCAAKFAADPELFVVGQNRSVTSRVPGIYPTDHAMLPRNAATGLTRREPEKR